MTRLGRAWRYLWRFARCHRDLLAERDELLEANIRLERRTAEDQRALDAAGQMLTALARKRDELDRRCVVAQGAVAELKYENEHLRAALEMTETVGFGHRVEET